MGAVFHGPYDRYGFPRFVNIVYTRSVTWFLLPSAMADGHRVAAVLRRGVHLVPLLRGLWLYLSFEPFRSFERTGPDRPVCPRRTHQNLSFVTNKHNSFCVHDRPRLFGGFDVHEAGREPPLSWYERSRRRRSDAWSIRPDGGPRNGAFGGGRCRYTNVPPQFSVDKTALAQCSSGGSPSSSTTSPFSSTVTTPRLFTAYGSRPISSMNPL